MSDANFIEWAKANGCKIVDVQNRPDMKEKLKEMERTLRMWFPDPSMREFACKCTAELMKADMARKQRAWEKFNQDNDAFEE